MCPFRAEDLYHTGIVCEFLEQTMQQFQDIAGYRWMRPVEYPVPIWTPAGKSVVTLKMVYSLDDPKLELIQQVPGTTWMASPGNPIHHIGYAVDDVTRASTDLIEKGYPLEVRSDTGPHRAGFHYHRMGDLRIELVPRTIMEDLQVVIEAMAEDTS